MRSFTGVPSVVSAQRHGRSTLVFFGLAVTIVALLLLIGSQAPLYARGARAFPFLFPQAFQTASVFTVDSVADENDAAPGDGVCADGKGACTLRAAIQEANALPGKDTIVFSIAGTGPHTIQPSRRNKDLPTITDPVIIDGRTQAGYTATTPMIVIDGSTAGANAYGLRVSAGSTELYGDTWPHDTGSSSKIVQQPLPQQQDAQSQQLKTGPTIHLPL